MHLNECHFFFVGLNAAYNEDDYLKGKWQKCKSAVLLPLSNKAAMSTSSLKFLFYAKMASLLCTTEVS